MPHMMILTISQHGSENMAHYNKVKIKYLRLAEMTPKVNQLGVSFQHMGFVEDA